MPNILSLITTFALGLITGSFLNQLIYRAFHHNLPKSLTRSFCDHCRHTLAWYDLIPVLTFILLRGKCRYCKKSITWQYPLVELTTGIIFALIFYNQFPFSNNQFLISLLYQWAIFSLLIAIFVSDLRYLIIPDKFIYPAIIVAFLYQLLWAFGFWNLKFVWNLDFGIWDFHPLFNSLASAFLSAFAFLAIFLISGGKWLGFGDVKLAFFMGLFLAFPSILVAFFFAFMLGAIIGLALIAIGRAGPKSQIAFGPFLIAGTVIAFFWGSDIIAWYLKLTILPLYN